MVMRPMRRLPIALSLTLVTTLAGVARNSAAEPYDARRFGGRGLQHGVLLLLNEPVQKELSITPEQQSQLTEIQTEFGKVLSELRPKPAKAPETPEQWETYNRAMLDAYTKASNETWPRAEKILSESQKSRLQEILVQCRGPAGVDDPLTSERLKLTDTQKKSLSSIREEHIRRLQDLMAERDSRVMDDVQKDILAFEKERDADILLVLTDSQRAAFEKLKGKPFDLGQVRNGPFANGVFGPRKKMAQAP
jgi:Spy/CpxP family protein refolding chaperone